MVDVSIRVDKRGPLFDGRAAFTLKQGCDRAQDVIALNGADMVRARLNVVLRKQTPYYRLQVTTKDHPSYSTITDSGVIYGPWLEGTGSRNRTTRFKGYGTFRLIRQALDRQARLLGEEALQPYVRRMG